MPERFVSGAQYALRTGGYVAEIASVGGTLRSLTRRGRDLVVPFAADEVRPAMRGALLAPWPNRTADGRYEFGGAVHRLEVNEIETGTASHGLVAWQDFTGVQDAPDRVRLSTTIEARPGYPWRVRLDVDFALTADGLVQESTATNLSGTPAPFGLGGHPYLLAGPPGPDAISSWKLELPASTVLLISADRLLPMAAAPVSGEFDFRGNRTIAATRLNHAFTDLTRGEDGLTRVRVTNGEGIGAEVEWDARCPWVQIYTTDASAGAEHRHAVAVEPMTCPPDALNSKHDLLSIPPGGSVSAGWVIRGIG